MKKYRLVISHNTVDHTHDVFLLDMDYQSLSGFPQTFNTFLEAFQEVKSQIQYCNTHSPLIQTFFSVTTNYSKIVPEQFIDLNIWDDEAMCCLILSR